MQALNPQKKRNSAPRRSAGSRGKQNKLISPKPTNQPAKQGNSGKRHVQVSEACSSYCHALCNPFEAKVTGVPSFPALPSLKVKVYTRGTAYTGTAGVGFVGFNALGAVAGDRNCIFLTDATFAGTGFDVTSTPGVSGAPANAPFNIADFDGTLAARVVGCGLRIRYGGTELNRGGFKVALVDPTHSSLNGRDEASLNREKQTKRYAVSRQWTNILWRPVQNSELQFATTAAAVTPNAGVLMISPDVSINELFEWELFGIIEYQGVAARGQTHTNTDPIGFAAVTSTVAQMNGVSQAPASQIAQAMHQGVTHYIGHAISGVIDAGNEVKQLATQASSMKTIFEDILEIGAPLLAWL